MAGSIECDLIADAMFEGVIKCQCSGVRGTTGDDLDNFGIRLNEIPADVMQLRDEGFRVYFIEYPASSPQQKDWLTGILGDDFEDFLEEVPVKQSFWFEPRSGKTYYYQFDEDRRKRLVAREERRPALEARLRESLKRALRGQGQEVYDEALREFGL